MSLYYIKNQQDATLVVLFITNCKNTLHVSDAFCVQHQEYVKLYEQPLVHVMGRDDVHTVRTSKVGCLLHYVIAYLVLVKKTTDLGRLYWIYIIRTLDMHQWLFIQFYVLLMLDAESV